MIFCNQSKKGYLSPQSLSEKPLRQTIHLKKSRNLERRKEIVQNKQKKHKKEMNCDLLDQFHFSFILYHSSLFSELYVRFGGKQFNKPKKCDKSDL